MVEVLYRSVVKEWCCREVVVKERCGEVLLQGVL